MSLSYGFIASTNNDHHKHKISSGFAILKLLEETNNAPPSYSCVLAEKYQQQQQQQQQCTTLGKKLDDEISTLLKSMKKSTQETESLLILYQHYYQRLKIKNEHILKRLQLVIEISASDNDTTTFSNKPLLDQSEYAYQQDTNDSLSRMNTSLEKLIQEAESSLQTRLSSHEESSFTLRKTRSCPQFIKPLAGDRRSIESDKYPSSNSDHNSSKLKLQQQKNRYLYSEWKLAIAMKELLRSVRQQELTTNDQQIHHHHHHHIHHHHHHYIYHNVHTTKPRMIMQDIIQKENTSADSNSSSLTSLFKYALDTVGGFISQQQPLLLNKFTVSKSVKYRTIFLSSLLILQRYNKRRLWVRRGQHLIHTWKSRRFHLYTHWVEQTHLLFFMLKIFASSSSSHL